MRYHPQSKSTFGTEEERQLLHNSVSTFLASSLNTEVVYCILECISRRAAKETIEDERKSRNWSASGE